MTDIKKLLRVFTIALLALGLTIGVAGSVAAAPAEVGDLALGIPQNGDELSDEEALEFVSGLLASLLGILDGLFGSDGLPDLPDVPGLPGGDNGGLLPGLDLDDLLPIDLFPEEDE